jgi:sulfatase modifying factor 1
MTDLMTRGDFTVPTTETAARMIRIESGSFRMGADDGEADETTVRRTVRIGHTFWLGRYVVTQREYTALMGNNPSHYKGANLPVEMVSWHDAVAFCAKLTEQEYLAGRVPAGYAYRLPTEAEWEYAARGGNDSSDFIYAGSNNLDDVAWYRGNSGSKPHPVGEKAPNGLGLYDMSGNVWEWCYDWYSGSFYDTCGYRNPVNLQQSWSRVGRGGGWADSARFCRSSNRSGIPPGYAGSHLGFRIALAPVIKGKEKV